MKFAVFDNNKPACVLGFPMLKSWKTNTFDTLEEVWEYAKNWLGDYAGGMPSLVELEKRLTELNAYRWEYSGYGDYLEIRMVA